MGMSTMMLPYKGDYFNNKYTCMLLDFNNGIENFEL